LLTSKAIAALPAEGCTGTPPWAGLADAPANCEVMEDARLLGNEALICCMMALIVGCANAAVVALGTAGAALGALNVMTGAAAAACPGICPGNCDVMADATPLGNDATICWRIRSMVDWAAAVTAAGTGAALGATGMDAGMLESNCRKAAAGSVVDICLYPLTIMMSRERKWPGLEENEDTAVPPNVYYSAAAGRLWARYMRTTSSTSLWLVRKRPSVVHIVLWFVFPTGTNCSFLY